MKLVSRSKREVQVVFGAKVFATFPRLHVDNPGCFKTTVVAIIKISVVTRAINYRGD